MGMKYQCNMCKGHFESEWTDEEAREEYTNNFGQPVQEPEREIVCETCYKMVMGE